ncbi:MAG: hypothetical protein KAR31_08185, partial [Candidatus Omnitrophica bacterium]|nr:hypothetical protein [Candidatus Omnitrophota bacterium]
RGRWDVHTQQWLVEALMNHPQTRFKERFTYFSQMAREYNVSRLLADSGPHQKMHPVVRRALLELMNGDQQEAFLDWLRASLVRGVSVSQNSESLDYCDAESGKDIADVIDAVHARGFDIWLVTHGWKTGDRRAQKAAEHLTALPFDFQINLSFHIWHNDAFRAVYGNGSQTKAQANENKINRIAQKYKAQFINVIRTFRNKELIVRYVYDGMKQMTAINNLQKRIWQEIKDETGFPEDRVWRWEVEWTKGRADNIRRRFDIETLPRWDKFGGINRAFNNIYLTFSVLGDVSFYIENVTFEGRSDQELLLGEMLNEGYTLERVDKDDVPEIYHYRIKEPAVKVSGSPAQRTERRTCQVPRPDSISPVQDSTEKRKYPWIPRIIVSLLFAVAVSFAQPDYAISKGLSNETPVESQSIPTRQLINVEQKIRPRINLVYFAHDAKEDFEAIRDEMERAFEYAYSRRRGITAILEETILRARKIEEDFKGTFPEWDIEKIRLDKTERKRFEEYYVSRVTADKNFTDSIDWKELKKTRDVSSKYVLLRYLADKIEESQEDGPIVEVHIEAPPVEAIMNKIMFKPKGKKISFEERRKLEAVSARIRDQRLFQDTKMIVLMYPDNDVIIPRGAYHTNLRDLLIEGGYDVNFFMDERIKESVGLRRMIDSDEYLDQRKTAEEMEIEQKYKEKYEKAVRLFKTVVAGCVVMVLGMIIVVFRRLFKRKGDGIKLHDMPLADTKNREIDELMRFKIYLEQIYYSEKAGPGETVIAASKEQDKTFRQIRLKLVKYSELVEHGQDIFEHF